MTALRFAMIFILVSLCSEALAERRVALVIGNSAYRYAVPLENPKNDALDMAAKLEGLGFDVVRGEDLDLSSMRSTVREFIGKLDGADMSLFFFAGHGVQVNGTNYMAPVDARLSTYNDLDFEAMSMDLVLSAMERTTKVNLIFLDACRDSPFSQTLARSMGTRSGAVGRGLARLGTGVGSLIAFATQPGNVALDGTGRNSPFTSALLKNLGTPGQDIMRDLVNVRRDVLAATAGKQVPWENSSLTGDIILQPLSIATGAPSPQSQDVEVAYWETIKGKTDKRFFEAYLRQYPDGAFASLASLKIDEIDAGSAERSTGQPAVESTNTMAAIVRPDDRQLPSNDPQSAFEKASKINTKRGWDRFLLLFGDTPLATEAQEKRLAVLEELHKYATIVGEKGLDLNPQDRIRIQERLRQLGYSTGDIDGVFGARTRSQLKAYQQARGMPETGEIDRKLLQSADFKDLGIQRELPSNLFDRAQDLAVEDLAEIETDERILRAAECFRGSAISYGEFQGHVYVAVAQLFVSWKHASRVAVGCGGYLVSIGTQDENDFIFSLIANDDKMFLTAFDGNRTFRQGPWIGLVQDQSAPEPRGGWSWSNGEKTEFTNWSPGKPQGGYADDDFGSLFAARKGKSDGTDLVAKYWSDASSTSRVKGFIVEFE